MHLTETCEDGAPNLAAIFDRPIVNVRFDGRRTKPYLRSARRHYDTEHYRQVLGAGAVRLADSPEELIHEVNRYLADPSLERVNRARLVEALCHRVDGHSGTRVADEIASIAARRATEGWPPAVKR